MVASYLFVYKTAIINADQKGYIVTGISIATNFLRTVLQIAVLLIFRQYLVYLVIDIVINIAGNLYSSIKASNMYPYIREKHDLDRKEKREIFINIKSIFIYKVSSVLLNSTDNIIISALVSTAMVGIYSNYQLISGKLIGIFALIFTSVTASIGNLIVKENEEKRYQVFQCEQTLSYVIACIVVPCFVALANELIYLWIGKEYVLGDGIIYIIGLNMYMNMVFQPLWSYREATGLYRRTKWIMLLCCMINIILSIALGKIIGIGGILLATFIARLSTYAWVEPKILYADYFNKSAVGYYAKTIVNAAIMVGITFILVIVSSRWHVADWVGLTFKGAVLALISSFIVIIVYSKTEGMKLLCSRLMHMVKG